MPTKFTASAIATSTYGRKIHLAPLGRFVCGNTGTLDTVVAELPEDGGLYETLDTLAAANVAPSKMCSKCFMPRTRAMYLKRRTAATA